MVNISSNTKTNTLLLWLILNFKTEKIKTITNVDVYVLGRVTKVDCRTEIKVFFLTFYLCPNVKLDSQ
jgi:hypothetical protein